MNIEAIEARYREHCTSGSAIAHHLPALRELASRADVVVELGVQRGHSTTALLRGFADGVNPSPRLISYDIVETEAATELEFMAPQEWSYRLGDSRIAPPVLHDLLFIDSLHTAAQVRVELHQWAGHTGWAIAFHDVVTFGTVGNDPTTKTGEHLPTTWGDYPLPPEKQGIMPAILAWMAENPEWRVRSFDPESHGLLVLEKRDE